MARSVLRHRLCAGPASLHQPPAQRQYHPSCPGRRVTQREQSDRPLQREDGGKKAESPSDSGKSSKDSTASDREGDKSDRKSTDAARKDETPKAAAPGDDKSDRKATDMRRKDETPKASAPATDTPGKAAATGGDGKKGADLSDQKRTTLHEKLSRDRTRHAANVRITVSIGATVPRNVQIYDLPPDVIEIAPEYRSYRYVWVDDEIVIIDPARYVVIAVVGGGGRSAGSSGDVRLSLTDNERRLIVKHVPSYGGQGVRERVDVGGRIPESVALMAFPEEVIAEVPRLRGYRYVFVENDIAVVDPHNTTVLVKINH